MLEGNHLQGTQTLSSKISRRLGSGIAKETVILAHAQCIMTTSCKNSQKKNAVTQNEIRWEDPRMTT